MAARLLHKAGLTVSQIPQAVQVTRETVEQWLQKEMESGNAKQVLQVLKGQVQEKGPKLLLDKLQDLLLLRLMLHLGIRGAMATNIVALLLPFVLKRVYKMAQQNPTVQTWWQEQEWRHRLPTLEQIKAKVLEKGKNLKPLRSPLPPDSPLPH